MPDESHRPIIDAGPGLNFFSINKERLLISVLGKLSAPETVQNEVFRKARTDERFRAAAVVWRKMTPDWILILADEPTPQLEAAVRRITHEPMAQRAKHAQDLGEIMVIAHAVVAAESGQAVTILMDDRLGSRIAIAEINRLERERRHRSTTGSIRLVNTLTVPERAAGGQYVPDKAAMHATYARLRCLDDGLPPIGKTNLLTSDRWRCAKATDG